MIADMRQVALELNMLSEVPAATLERSSPTADPDRKPKGESTQLGDVWMAYFQAAQLADEASNTGVEQQTRVYHRARGVLARQKGRAPLIDPNLSDDEWAEEVFMLYEGEQAAFAGLVMGVSADTIRRRLVVQNGVIVGRRDGD